MSDRDPRNTDRPSEWKTESKAVETDVAADLESSESTTVMSETRPQIANHKVTNKQEFDSLTETPRQIAGLYFYLQLDCLVSCAYHVGLDFFRRPHLYTDLGGNTAELLARLRARYGSDEIVPSQPQRDEMFFPIFGQSNMGPTDAYADFPQLRDELVGAASAFAERAYDTGVGMLRERVRTTHRPFKDYLTGLQGDSLTWMTDQALAHVTSVAYEILRDEGVCAVFGMSTSPKAEWPFVEDANADKLVEQISKQLTQADSHPALTRAAVSNRQRAALRGAEALATILDFNEDGSNEDIDLLITKCYTWGSALGGLSVQPIQKPVTAAPDHPSYVG